MKIQALNLQNKDLYQSKTNNSIPRVNHTSFGAVNIKTMKLSAGAIESMLTKKELFGDTFTFLMHPNKKSMLVEVITFSIRDRESKEVIAILKELQVLVDKTRKDFERTMLGSSSKDREKILKKMEKTAKEDKHFLGKGFIENLMGVEEIRTLLQEANPKGQSFFDNLFNTGFESSFSNAITHFVNAGQTDKAKTIIRAVADSSIIDKGINKFFAQDVQVDLMRQLFKRSGEELNSISAETLNTGSAVPSEYFVGLIGMVKAYPAFRELETSISSSSRTKAFAEALKSYLPQYHLILGVL